MVGLAEIVLALSGVFPLSLALMFLVGLGAISMAATANTTIQLAVPDHLRGRTMSIYVTVFASSAPVGGLMMGGIASSFSVEAALAVGGIACTVIGAHGPRLAAERRRAGCDRGGHAGAARAAVPVGATRTVGRRRRGRASLSQPGPPRLSPARAGR